MMKKLLLPVLIFCAFAASAQLNNSWIDYSKTYYKFKLVSDNLCRIPQSAIAAAGLQTVNADQFQLWRNGQQVRLYTSVTGAALGSSDYIEFWGQMNDGKADAQLYLQPQFQLADRYSLETDTSTYFFTVNPAGGNLRYASVANNSPGTATPDTYFMRSIDVYYRGQQNKGYGRDLGEYVYSSAYDNGEGPATADITAVIGTPTTYTETITGLNVYNGAGAPANGLSFRIKTFGNSDNSGRTTRVKIFNNQAVTPMVTYNTNEAVANVSNLPLSYLQNTSSVDINVINDPLVSGAINDRICIATMGITYPATFNFNNQKSFAFDLAASSTGNNIVIDNFNYGTTAPVLYDINNGRRYIGDITSTPGKVKFVLPASVDPVRKFILNNTEPANVYSVNTLVSKTFVNYNTTATSGDYIIISNPVLYNDGSGVNNVELYRQYRSSANGGGFNAKTYDINELTDQFGFGIKNHPGAVRDFVRFMDIQYAVKPKFILLIGRGMTYFDAKPYESTAAAAQLNLVPTFGWPSSDVLMAARPGTEIAITPIGRIAAVNGTEVGNYLQKVIQYEDGQRTQSPLIADKAWMKNTMQIVGGANEFEQSQFDNYSDIYKSITDTAYFGGHTERFDKTSVATVQQSIGDRILQLFHNGLGLIQYFGHSSATAFEFNLANPELYDNAGKYPFFNISGCSAGNFYNYDPSRLTGNLGISEKYILLNQKGSIGFLADTHFGVPYALDDYNSRLYKDFSYLMYGQRIGDQLKEVQTNLGGASASIDYLRRIHLEEINLHGDPAIKINNYPKPDYVIEDQSVKITPTIISIADPSFHVRIDMQNIGRAINDSFRISIKRLLPGATVPVTIKDSMIKATLYADSMDLNIPINPATDKGDNQLIVELDWTNRINEIYETNNKVTKHFTVFEDELRPVFPYNFAIVNTQNNTFSASTANALVSTRNYVMEIDTTELFNSPFKKSYTANGPGGVIQFTPTNIIYTDSMVYYWRTAVVPSNGIYVWNNSSFVYLPAGTAGFNQSHYYQQMKSSYDANIYLAADRKLKFNVVPTTLNISTGNFPPNDYPTTYVAIGSSAISQWGNHFGTLQFTVLDGLTGNVIKNTPGGSYNSNPPATLTNQFEFYFSDQAHRNNIRDFIQNNIPDNATVVIYNLLFNVLTNSWVNDWQADNGGTNNLYTTLKGYGFTQIDSFYRNIPIIFKFVKNGSVAPYQKVGLAPTDLISAALPLNVVSPRGEITSPLFGPAAAWSQFHWRGSSVESPTNDSLLFTIIGVNNSGTETALMTVDSTQKDVNISSISAVTYPYLKIKMLNRDSANGTPYQLRYWRLNYSPVPEGAIAPNIKFSMKDTVEAGDPIQFAVAFKNVSGVNFTRIMKINMKIRTAANYDSIINIAPGRILLASPDTIIASYTIPSEHYQGSNTLYIEFNPDSDQPEQFHFNNYLYKDFYVKSDLFNPLLDVTFDGVHILSRDIVSSKPGILIKLKDENRFLALKDTSLIKVQLRYPDQSLHTYYFNGDTMRFNPANLSSGENAATIDFKPYLPDDGEYELIVSGKDASGNSAGNMNYHTVFTVINKPMISEMLNYPNPFTTSTAFVFTLTGSKVPQNLRIQVLTITGKIVREITKEELGPIHIGRNITEFKWDGSDMYGQKLANGVYIYRVITNLEGKSLDKYKADGDNTDKFFNKGYGKMYLMR